MLVLLVVMVGKQNREGVVKSWREVNGGGRVSESTLKHSNLLKSGIFSIGIAGQDNRNEKCLMEYYDGFWDDFGCEDSLTCLCRQVDRISLNINLFVFILVLKCVLL